MVKDHSDSERGNPLPPQCYSFRLTARVLLYAPSHRQDSTYHGLCYTSRGSLAGTRNSSMDNNNTSTVYKSYYIYITLILDFPPAVLQSVIIPPLCYEYRGPSDRVLK